MAISRPHQNPRGQLIRAGGMTLVNCQPGCEAEFRSASDPKGSIIHDQLEAAGWQVIETIDGGRKHYTYRCPAHRHVRYAPMSGAVLPERPRQTGAEKRAAGRASHDGGDTP